jgi:elongation factor 2
MDPKIQEAIREGVIPSDEKRIKDKKQLEQTLRELGMEKDLAKGVYAVVGQNMLVNATKGIQYLFETRELLIEAFKEAMTLGPRTREPCMGVMIKLMDAKLHEDAIHRGPAQIIPAMRASIYGAMVTSSTVLLEPKMKVFVNVPMDMVGGVTREMQQRRSIVEDMSQEGDISTIVSKAPVAEMFGFASSIRSATQGRALWTTEFSGFEKVPRDMQPNVTKEIRERKGLKPDPPTADYYSS